MTVAGGLAAAGAPGEWKSAIARAVEPFDEIEFAADGVIDLAEQKPVVCPEPSFGSTIAAILGTPVKAAEPEPEPPRRRKRAPSEAIEPRPSRNRARPRPEPGEGSADRKGATARPPNVSLKQPRPADQGTNPDRKTADDVQRLPAQVDSDLLGRIAPPVPPSPVTPSRGGERADVIPAPGSRKPSRVSVPPPAGLDDALARVARTVGSPTVDRLKPSIGVVPRSGPAIASAKLRALATGERSAAAQVPPPTETPDRGAAAAESQAHDPALDSRPRRTVTPGAVATTVKPPAVEPVEATRSEPGTSPANAADETVVGHVSTHDEMPPVPQRDRTTAAAPINPRREVTFPPAPGAELSELGPAAPQLVERDDLERQMKEILDDAARRHGIEI